MKAVLGSPWYTLCLTGSGRDFCGTGHDQSSQSTIYDLLFIIRYPIVRYILYNNPVSTSKEISPEEEVSWHGGQMGTQLGVGRVRDPRDRTMRFVSTRDLREKSIAIWKTLPSEGEMVVTRRGRPVAILAAVSESNLEESLSAFRRTRAVEAVAGLQRRSVEKGTARVSMEGIEAEIKEMGRKRSR